MPDTAVPPTQGGPARPRPRRAPARALRTLGLALVAVAVIVVVMYAFGAAGFYDLPYALAILPGGRDGRALAQGVLTTLLLIAIVIPLGFGLGFVFGWGRTSRSWFVRAVSTTYVEFFRGMPPFVLIAFTFLIALALVQTNPRIEDPSLFATNIAVLALAAHSGAYQAEIIRAGILSVPAGQREAGEAIGMTKGSVLRSVTLPQMLRVSLPALGNEFASVIKDTSLLSAVGALDLAFQGQNLTSELVTSGRYGLVFVVWIEVAVLYFIITSIVNRGLQTLEARYRVPGLEAAQL